jgi:signal transduction histidine kinase
MLLRKLVLISVLLAVVLAALSVWGIERVRARDRVLAIERLAVSQTTDLVRARCEANPKWFLAGPREAAPSAAVLADPDADVLAPRPDAKPRPMEFFAYDVEYIGQSTAAPRLPAEMRAALRRGDKTVTMPFETEEGVGVQTAIATNWEGPCTALLFRMHPPPGQFAERARIFGFLAVGIFVALMVVAYPIDQRVHGIGRELRASARTEYREPASIKGRDELSSLGFAFNEATTDIRRLQTDVRDREADFRRFVAHVSSEVDEPMRASLANEDVGQLTDTALHLSNLLTGARFRDAGDRVHEAVDVAAAAQVAVREFEPAIRRKGVTLEVGRLESGIVVQGDPAFLTQAVRNLISNALLRVGHGGVIKMSVQKTTGGSWSLRVSDTGPDLGHAELRGLNAVRRFRGDEGRGAGLRGDIGLSLAVVHEVCHRFGLTLNFRGADSGGLEVTLSGVQQLQGLHE